MASEYFKQRIIMDIENNDTLIQVTGYVKEIRDNEVFILDDESGIITVNMKDLEYELKLKSLINVIGKLDIKSSGEKIILAQIIQDMSKLNFKYYKKLYEIKKSLE